MTAFVKSSIDLVFEIKNICSLLSPRLEQVALIPNESGITPR